MSINRSAVSAIDRAVFFSGESEHYLVLTWQSPARSFGRDAAGAIYGLSEATFTTEQEDLAILS